MALGLAVRAMRIRKRKRQEDLAKAAKVSRRAVSLIECGHASRVPLGTVRAVVAAAGGHLDLRLRTPGGELDRLINAGHAAMQEVMAQRFSRLAGWSAIPEVSYSIYGERGVIDIVAWHPGRRALLIIELKTALVDVGDLVGSMDRRRRLARQIARERGWDPGEVSVWVILLDTRTNRRRLAEFATTLRAAFPSDGRAMRRWLREPTGSIAALSFLPLAPSASARHAMARPTRVRRRSTDAPVTGAVHNAPDARLLKPRIGVSFSG